MSAACRVTIPIVNLMAVCLYVGQVGGIYSDNLTLAIRHSCLVAAVACITATSYQKDLFIMQLIDFEQKLSNISEIDSISPEEEDTQNRELQVALSFSFLFLRRVHLLSVSVFSASEAVASSSLADRR
jgi:hypothetical protein